MSLKIQRCQPSLNGQIVFVPNLFYLDCFPCHSEFVLVLECAGGCKVVAAAEDSLAAAAGLLGVDREELRDSLISRVMQATRGGVKGTAIK